MTKEDKIGLLEILEEIRSNTEIDNLSELEVVGDYKAVMKFIHKKASKAISLLQEENTVLQ